MLAYCTALGLAEGHLVYAKGNEAGRVHEVVNAGVVIRAHTVNLAAEPAGLLSEVSRLVGSHRGWIDVLLATNGSRQTATAHRLTIAWMSRVLISWSAAADTTPTGQGSFSTVPGADR